MGHEGPTERLGGQAALVRGARHTFFTQAVLSGLKLRLEAETKGTG